MFALLLRVCVCVCILRLYTRLYCTIHDIWLAQTAGSYVNSTGHYVRSMCAIKFGFIADPFGRLESRQQFWQLLPPSYLQVF